MGLRVCIDARIVPGAFGGVEQFTLGLVDALSKLTDGDEEYLVLTYGGASEWIEPYVGGPCRLVATETLPEPPRLRFFASQRALRPLRRPWHAAKALRGPRGIPISRLDGRLERLADVVHFPKQGAALTDLPSVYHPWDLQHRHLSDFFTSYERLSREVSYAAFAHQAAAVVVASEWARRDFADAYPEIAAKLHVIPVPPVTEAYPVPVEADLENLTQRLGLEVPFAFYPAKTWPHKNHIRLLEALDALRRNGVRVPLVCSGGVTDHAVTIQRRARDLGLERQVTFAGFVSPLDVQCLYRLSRCLIFPSRFEGWGLPLMEAFRAGVPVACSNVTCLPEQADGAAVVFDPEDVSSIAGALERIWTNEALRHELRRRGRERSSSLSWTHTAQRFRAYYRELGGRGLTSADSELLVT
jgi:glycosyltransferase involved in cell wall biosynthesis